MRVSRLDENGDWTMGRGLANYAIKSEAVQQKLKTRLLSWSGDWFLDTDAHLPWGLLLSNRNTTRQIEREVERVTLETEGIARIDSLQLIENRGARHVTIRMTVTDIYSQTFELDLPVLPEGQ